MSFILPLVLALAPGMFAYVTGRSLAARADDPDLPDLLLARGRRLLYAWSGSVGFIVAFRGEFWWIALMLAGLVAGTLPLRRALFGETWGFAGYLLWWARNIVGGAGFLLAILATPWLVLLARPYHWAAAAAAGALLLAWRHAAQEVWLRMLRARPLEDPPLRARFGEIAARAGMPLPALYRIGPRGGTLPNAFALPHARRPAVALGHTLLEVLDEDETAGVFAHELAHLEQFDARRLRVMAIRSMAAVCLAVSVPLVMVAAGWGEWTGVALLIGVALVLVAAWKRPARSRADETAADGRAVALSGDPEALIRGLTRIHQLGRLPRRWPREMEARATHPSLARRIAALRGEAPSPGLLAEPAVVPSSREGSWVAFDPRRVSFFEGVPAGTAPAPASLHEAAASVRSVAYGELVDLRVVSAGEAPALAATDRAGISWSFPVFPDDVQKVRDLVQQVDGHLGAPAPVPGRWVPRFVAAGAFLVSGFAGAFALLLLPVLLVLARPTATSLAAMGAVALGQVALRVADGSARWATQSGTLALGGLAFVGVAALLLAFLRRRGEDAAPRRPWLVLAPLAAVAALMLARLGVAAGDGGLRWAAGEPDAAVLGLMLLAVGAGLLLSRRRSPRWAGAGMAAAAVPALLLSLGTDVLRPQGQELAWSRATAVAVESVAFTGFQDLAALSPSGRAFAVRERVMEAGPDGHWQYTVGGFGAGRRSFYAAAVAFPSDSQVMVLAPVGDSLELRMESVEPSGVQPWRRGLPRMSGPQLALDGRGGWMVWGRDGSGASVLFTARDAGPVRRVQSPPGARAVLAAPLGAEGALLLLRPAREDADTPLPWLLRPAREVAWEAWLMDVWGERPLGAARGFATCSAPDPAGGGVLCSVAERGRATLWSVGVDGSMRRLGRVPRDLWELAMRDGSLGAVRADGEILLVDAAAGRGRRMRLPGVEYARAAHPVPGGMAVLHADTGSVLTRFRAVEQGP